MDMMLVIVLAIIIIAFVLDVAYLCKCCKKHKIVEATDETDKMVTERRNFERKF